MAGDVMVPVLFEGLDDGEMRSLRKRIEVLEQIIEAYMGVEIYALDTYDDPMAIPKALKRQREAVRERLDFLEEAGSGSERSRTRPVRQIQILHAFLRESPQKWVTLGAAAYVLGVTQQRVSQILPFLREDRRFRVFRKGRKMVIELVTQEVFQEDR
jgi:hypothetical protein